MKDSQIIESQAERPEIDAEQLLTVLSLQLKATRRAQPGASTRFRAGAVIFAVAISLGALLALEWLITQVPQHPTTAQVAESEH